MLAYTYSSPTAWLTVLLILPALVGVAGRTTGGCGAGETATLATVAALLAPAALFAAALVAALGPAAASSLSSLNCASSEK